MNQVILNSNEDAIQKIMEEYKKTTSMFIHELRNPLSLLKGTLQYIEMKHSEVKSYKYWSQLFELIQEMENMMADASMLNSSTTLNLQNTDLKTLIQGVVQNYTPQADNEHKKLSMNISPESESVLSSYPCDAAKMKQVISNLIKNALEATSPDNFIEVSVSVVSEDDHPLLSVQISNNGQQIPEDEIGTIFQPFVTYKKGGTGVGLALAKRVIENHMGRISVSSTESLTSFTILLPIPAKS